MTCMKQEFCIHEKYCQRHIGQNFDSCILFSRNSKPMTNEEWFCQLPTEEKADFLANSYPKSVGEALIKISNGDKENWVKWLKEEHHGN